jgi:hypothetical protein
VTVAQHFGQATMRGRGQHNRHGIENLSTQCGIYIFFNQFTVINRLKKFTVSAKCLIYRARKKSPNNVDNFVNYYLSNPAKPRFLSLQLECHGIEHDLFFY